MLINPYFDPDPEDLLDEEGSGIEGSEGDPDFLDDNGFPPEPPDSPDNDSSGADGPFNGGPGLGDDNVDPPDQPEVPDFDPPTPPDQQIPPDQQPPQPPPPSPPPQPCPDDTIANTMGIDRGEGRNDLEGFDNAFDGAAGERFKELVEQFANEFDIDPAILAVNALTETGRGTYLSRNKVRSVLVGLDFWDTLQQRVRNNVDGARSLSRTEVLRDSNGIPVNYENENFNDAGPIHLFNNGQDALRAMAATIKFYQNNHTGVIGSSDYSNLPYEVRNAALRLHFHKGPGRARQLIREANSANADTKRVLLDQGPTGREYPVRTATVRSAQTSHVSQHQFERALPCPDSDYIAS